MILILKIQPIVFKALILLVLPLSGCAPYQGLRRPVTVSGPQINIHEPATFVSAKKTVEESLRAYQDIHDYTATCFKEERLDGGPLRPKETIFVKFRKPDQIYMKWVKEPNKDMELIYPVKENKMVVEPGGWIDILTPRLYLNPTDKLAMMGNRHPVTEADLGFLIQRFASDFNRAVDKNEVEIHFENPAQILGRSSHRIEAVLPADPSAGYYCYRSVIYFDSKTKLPLEVEFYDWENKLFERYSFTDVKINPGLRDKDFDENNPEYDF